MIAANELRIGNYLIFKGNGKPYQVSNISEDEIDKDWELIEPIPLTSEVLEKLGFEFDTVTFSKSYFLLAEGGNGFDIWIGGLSKVKLNPIKYVHELQNLFYAITKEELNYSI